MENQTHLQWNCNGIRAKHEEIQRLIKELKPTTIALQETKLGADTYKINNMYTIYNKGSLHQPNSGGVALIIHKNTNHKILNLQTNLQAIAATIIDNRQTTICNIYLPPNQAFPYNELSQLIDQLEQPFLILGDVNAHDPLWGDQRTDQRGKLLARLILEKDLVILNHQEPTYHRLHDNSVSIIDLALTKGRQASTYTWNKIDDLHGSDHFPIMIQKETRLPTTHQTRWKLDHANWPQFTKMLDENTQLEQFNSPEEVYNHIT